MFGLGLGSPELGVSLVIVRRVLVCKPCRGSSLRLSLGSGLGLGFRLGNLGFWLGMVRARLGLVLIGVNGKRHMGKPVRTLVKATRGAGVENWG